MIETSKYQARRRQRPMRTSEVDEKQKDDAFIRTLLATNGSPFPSSPVELAATPLSIVVVDNAAVPQSSTERGVLWRGK